MAANTDPRFIAAPAESSLVRGGPFYRFQQAVGLIHPNQWNLGRRIAVLIAISWLPLIAITALLNSGVVHSLLTDYRVYARLLIAIPALLIGEILLDSHFHTVLASIREADLLGESDTAYMDGVIAATMRIRDAFLPELLILSLIIVRVATAYHGSVDATPWLAQGTGPDFQPTPAGWYAVWVGGVLWNFLLALGLWHWLLWTFVAFKLSTRNLKLVATHPDGHGGLGFLGLTVDAFAPIAFVATCVIGSTWRHNILRHGTHVMTYKLPAIVLVAVIALIGFGPLFCFVPRLRALRRRGIREYGNLGQLNSTEFQEKWIENRSGHEAEFLQAPESSRVSSYGQIYQKIKQLKPFPADRSSLSLLTLAVVLPALPALLTEIPLVVVLKELLKALH